MRQNLAIPSDVASFCAAEHARIVGALGLYTGDPLLAEELAQEALTRVCRDWYRIRNMAAPGAYAHRIAMNLAASHFRRRQAAHRAQRRLESSADPVHRDADGGDAVAVRQAVAALEERKRRAIVLRYYLGYSHAEIAEAMGARETTVRSLVHRAKVELRAALDVDELPGDLEARHA